MEISSVQLFLFTRVFFPFATTFMDFMGNAASAMIMQKGINPRTIDAVVPKNPKGST